MDEAITTTQVDCRNRHDSFTSFEISDPETDLSDNVPDTSNDEGDERRTLHTNDSNMPDLTVQLFVNALAKDLFMKIGMKNLTAAEIQQLTSILPGLLEAVAFKLGCKGSKQIYGEIMVLIYRHT